MVKRYAFVLCVLTFVMSCSLSFLGKGTGGLKEISKNDVTEFNQLVKNEENNVSSLVLLVDDNEKSSTVASDLAAIAKESKFKDINFLKVSLYRNVASKFAAKDGETLSEVASQVLSDADIADNFEPPVLVVYENGNVKNTLQGNEDMSDKVLEDIAGKVIPTEHQALPEGDDGKGDEGSSQTIDGVTIPYRVTDNFKGYKTKNSTPTKEEIRRAFFVNASLYSHYTDPETSELIRTYSNYYDPSTPVNYVSGLVRIPSKGFKSPVITASDLGGQDSSNSLVRITTGAQYIKDVAWGMNTTYDGVQFDEKDRRYEFKTFESNSEYMESRDPGVVVLVIGADNCELTEVVEDYVKDLAPKYSAVKFYNCRAFTDAKDGIGQTSGFPDTKYNNAEVNDTDPFHLFRVLYRSTKLFPETQVKFGTEDNHDYMPNVFVLKNGITVAAFYGYDKSKGWLADNTEVIGKYLESIK